MEVFGADIFRRYAHDRICEPMMRDVFPGPSVATDDLQETMKNLCVDCFTLRFTTDFSGVELVAMEDILENRAGTSDGAAIEKAQTKYEAAFNACSAKLVAQIDRELKRKELRIAAHELSAGAPLQPAELLALKPGYAFRECDACPTMIAVPAGKFLMGAHDGADHEKPAHEVTIARPFAVSRFEVTFAEWDACVADGPCTHRPDDKGFGRGKRPASNVSWDNVTNEFLPWLTRKTGKPYRLLSEAEWEYAARAGNRGKYGWGDDVGQDLAVCNGCGSPWDGKKAAPVGSFAPNSFGLHDMHGNVWEWVADCWHDNYAGAPIDGSAWTSGTCERRVARGGGFTDTPNYVLSSTRTPEPPANADDMTGFRVALTLAP
jgi:formylglycine-generating enzyme required for sulfatase activity